MFLDKDLLTHALTTNNLPEQLAAYCPRTASPTSRA